MRHRSLAVVELSFAGPSCGGRPRVWPRGRGEREAFEELLEAAESREAHHIARRITRARPPAPPPSAPTDTEKPASAVGQGGHKIVRSGGFEPPAFGTGNRCSVRLSYERSVRENRRQKPYNVRGGSPDVPSKNPRRRKQQAPPHFQSGAAAFRLNAPFLCLPLRLRPAACRPCSIRGAAAADCPWTGPLSGRRSIRLPSGF